MGMDVSGINPKVNASINDFPTLKKIREMRTTDESWKESMKLLDSDKSLSDKYWAEDKEYKDINCGVYFRNNCWWWRPLWNYCYAIADDIISEDVWDSGHCNDGAGLNEEDAKQLGERLLKSIENGECLKYQAAYMQHQEDMASDDEFATSYPFDIDNVKQFAKFCIQSGGFEIW